MKEHIHEVNPNHAHYFPCHRSITLFNKHNIDILHHVGVSTSKSFAAMTKQHWGYENIGCFKNDIRNHLDKKRHLSLVEGDAKGILEHFIHMQEANPNFFYAMALYEEQCLRHVFRVDAKSQE